MQGVLGVVLGSVGFRGSKIPVPCKDNGEPGPGQFVCCIPCWSSFRRCSSCAVLTGTIVYGLLLSRCRRYNRYVYKYSPVGLDVIGYVEWVRALIVPISFTCFRITKAVGTCSSYRSFQW